jgi:amino acid adenylation domain-containing protein
MNDAGPLEIETLVHLLCLRAEKNAASMAFSHVANDGSLAETVSFEALDRAARGIAGALAGRAPRGSRVILIASTPIPFIEGFFGLLYAGLVPVPAPPPGNSVGRLRIAAYTADCDAVAVLGTLADHQIFAAAQERNRSPVWWIREELAGGHGGELIRPLPDETAFLQYTSGSTSAPRGVVVTHRMVMSNERAIAKSFGHDESTIFCSWLPLFHDMGLIGGVLQPLYLGIPGYLLTPMQFLARPQRWLEAIGRYRVTTSGAPNFAYDLCVDQISPERRVNLDLSSWQIAFNGAEPLRARTLARFSSTFGPHGFSERAFYPCYGLAESTLFVAGSRPQRGPLALPRGKHKTTPSCLQADRDLDSDVHVGSGMAAPGFDLLIVDPSTGRTLPDGDEGEIWIAGASVARRYWTSSETSTPDNFAAVAAGHPDSSYLRTGDLGFLREGELFVTGRLKDLIIVHGRNYHPADLEDAAATVPLPWRRRSIAAFDGGGQQDGGIVILVERPKGKSGEVDAIARAIRATIRERCGVHVRTVGFVAGQHLPATTSGKLRRAECARMFAEGRFDDIALDLADSPVFDALVAPTSVIDATALLSRALQAIRGHALAESEMDRSFAELGFDSLDAASFAAILARARGIPVRASDILSARRIHDLADLFLTGVPPDLQPPAPLPDGRRPAAEAFIVLAERYPDRSADNVAIAFELPSGVDPGSCQEALGVLVRRHDALRTAFHRTDDGVVAAVVDEAALVLEQFVVDRDAMQRSVDDFAARPFDLAVAPLMHTALHAARDGPVVFQIVIHHAVIDLCSLTLLMDEFWLLLFGERLQDPAALPASDAGVEGLRCEDSGFWRRLFPTAALFAPVPRPTGVVEALAGRAIAFEMPQAVTLALRSTAMQLGSTMTALLLTAYQCILALYTGQTRVVTALPFYARPAGAEIPPIGCFVTTLPVVLEVGPDDSFVDLVGQVGRMLLDLISRQSSPAALEGVEIHREGSRTALMQFGYSPRSFNWLGGGDHAALGLKGHYSALRIGRHIVKPMPNERFDPAADLLLTTAEREGCLIGAIEYDAAHVSRTFAQGVLDSLKALLQALAESAARAAQPGLWVDPAATGWSGEKILTGETVLPQQPSALALFFQRHRAWRNSCAVEMGDQRWSYAELFQNVRRAARSLAKLGIGAGDRVAVEAHGSPELVGVLLALWHRGAVYCPIDPGYPDERRNAIRTRLDPKLVLTSFGVLYQSSGETGDAEDLGLATSGEAPAYVIFTSGSTGQPKGVVIPHRGICNTAAAQRIFDIQPGSRVLQASSIGFDASIFEIALALGHGATLVFPERRPLEAEQLREIIGRSHIDHLVLPPSLVEAMGSHVTAPQTLIVAGEACPRSLIRDWASRCRLFNAYGPTEASIWVSIKELSEPDADPLIGLPIDNVSVALVDSRLKPVPRGAPGELVVGGPGVALGYLGETERERKSFLRSMMGAGDIYRTGDRVRMRDNGSMEFLGRLDRQVKLNGVRVELEEVETVLAGAPGIARFAVAEVRSEDGRNQLAGFVVPSRESCFDPPAIRAYMRRRLPEVMIPTVWRAVDTIPLDAHGKADYGKLRASVARDTDIAGPRTPLGAPLQLRVAEACREVLGRYPAYQEDNLLELGLHSLNAARVLGRLSAALGRRIPVSLVFERPVLREFAAALETLGANEPFASVGAADVPTRYLLTPTQKDIWLHSKLVADTTYVVPMVVRLTGGLDSRALAEALALVVQRHPMLHSRIVEAHGEPCALIGGLPGFVLRTVDASHSQDPFEESRRAVEALVNEPFDFEKEIPVRALLVTLGADEFVFALITHHLFVDGWSVGVMVRDMSRFYAELANGRVPAVETESGITRCVEQITGATAHEQRLDAWRGLLAGFDAGKSYLPDTSSQSVRGVRAGRLSLPAKRLASLDRYAKKCGVSIFSVVTAAFSLVVGRQQGREDVVISVVSANRDDVESESAVGCLASVLPVRCSIAGDLPPAEFVRRIDRGIRAGVDLSGPSLSSIGTGLEQAGQSIRSSLLAAMIVQIDPAFYEFALADLQLSILPWRFGEPKAGLLLEVRNAGEGLELYLEADPAIFDEARTARVVAAIDASLEALTAEQPARVGDLTGLAPVEYVLVTTSFNDTRRDYGIEKPLHRLVEDAADRHPDIVAVRSDGAEITYAEFDRMTNGLAHLLQRSGVEVGEPVGVCCVPGLAQVLALHGVMKSGAAYVPLDPDLPASRHAYMIRDLGLRTVVCDRLEERWAALGVRRIVHPLRAEPRTARIAVCPGPHDPAYILFTSGSTGEPKAVANTHAGIVNRLLWMQDAFSLQPGERVLQKTTFTFDVSVWEYFWPLITGGTLCTIRPGGHLDPSYLYEVMRSEQVSILHFTPSALGEFLRSRDRFDLPRLRCLVTSGEALSADLRDTVFRLLKAELHNLYGPTEAAIDVSHWHCRSDDRRRSVPIGRPISNIQLYVVDEAGRPAPIGVPGELLIGGVGVASGYLGKPELTREKFVPDVFNPGSGRLYKTGDVARWTEEGVLEYFGRNDDQVKFHGVRIEPAEIDAALKATLGVAESVVVARGDGVNRRLVAFVVLGEQPLPPLREVRRRLAAQLPAAFIPAAVVPITHIPLLPSGKLDRRALPDGPPGAAVRTADSAPASPREAGILSAWRHVLGREDIGTQDNFFDVGGSSALLMRLQNELRASIAMNVPVIKLLKYPTVQSLAVALDDLPDAAGSPRDVAAPGVEKLHRLKAVAAQRKRNSPPER